MASGTPERTIHVSRNGLLVGAVILAIMLPMQSIAEDKLPKTERKQTTPTMAKFYKVDGSGQSKSENIAVTTLSNPEEEKPESNEQPQPRPKSKPKKKDSSKTINITINREKKPFDQQAEWQCERAGFYYTEDGRCVVPAQAYRAKGR